jgi:hypothetical protein
MHTRGACAVLALFPLIAVGAIQNGSWSLAPADQPDRVQFSMQGSQGEDHFNTSSPWKLADLQGLDWAATAKHDVSFSVVRDAGTIDCKGFVQERRGAGLFTFQPNPQYVPEMAKLGYSFEGKDLLSATIFDVSFEFARAMKSADVRGLDAGKLIAFRIHGVSPEFAGELGHLGYPHAPPDQLIALRIHGVTPEYIEGLRSKGLQNLTLDQLISLRIHGVD